MAGTFPATTDSLSFFDDTYTLPQGTQDTRIVYFLELQDART